ncbi:hypothetical protein JTB14_009096 [Gonioctena quinquepunctata]|nr:hypothetical protein JTB14_009096 [Gonioctena quinquepunctata]
MNNQTTDDMRNCKIRQDTRKETRMSRELEWKTTQETRSDAIDGKRETEKEVKYQRKTRRETELGSIWVIKNKIRNNRWGSRETDEIRDVKLGENEVIKWDERSFNARTTHCARNIPGRFINV